MHSEIYFDTLDKASIGGSGDITAKLEKWSDVYECAKLKCQLSAITDGSAPDGIFPFDSKYERARSIEFALGSITFPPSHNYLHC